MYIYMYRYTTQIWVHRELFSRGARFRSFPAPLPLGGCGAAMSSTMKAGVAKVKTPYKVIMCKEHMYICVHLSLYFS